MLFQFKCCSPMTFEEEIFSGIVGNVQSKISVAGLDFFNHCLFFGSCFAATLVLRAVKRFYTRMTHINVPDLALHKIVFTNSTVITHGDISRAIGSTLLFNFHRQLYWLLVSGDSGQIFGKSAGFFSLIIGPALIVRQA